MKRFFLKNLKVLLIAFSLLATILLGILVGLILVYQKGFPQIKNLEDLKPVVMTTVYDDQNTPIKDFAIEKRIIVRSSDIPDSLKNAIVAAEDNQFYSHWGINFRGFIRAVGGVLLHKKWGGGSSITMQLARGLFLTPEFSLSRKLKEMLLAIQIEKKYTKDQIMTFYCNKIFLGGSIYGVEAAARYYFGKPVREIKPAEAALIAGIIPNPNGIYSVFRRRDNVLKRRNYVLLKMMLLKSISVKEYQEGLAVKLPDKPADAGSESLADYFTEDTRKYLEAKYGDNLLYKGGLKVFTTLNGETQKWAEDALREGLRALDKRRGWRRSEKLFNLAENNLDVGSYKLLAWENAKIEVNQIIEGVVMEVGRSKAAVRIAGFKGELPAAGASWTRLPLTRLFKVGDVALFRILAVDKERMKLDLGLEQEPQVDGALLAVDNRTGEIQALRQTGSTFKPIIYTAALENGFSAATIIQDEPFSYVDEWSGELWEPRNHKGDFLGPLTLRRGLELSRNAVTARIMQAITPEVGLQYARKFGITSDLKPYMSMALGAFEVTLKEMVEAFTVFANYGVRVNSYFIRSIRDLNNNIIEENFPERKQVLEKETAFIMNYILQGVVQSGTGWRARKLPAPVGGKTGTTNDFTDAWFIGFTPSITVGVWVGFDQKKSLGKEETGSNAAAPIFVAFMENYLDKHPETAKFSPPSGVYMINIDKYTGKLLTPDCLYPFREAFLPGTEPLEFCNEEEHLKITDYYKLETDNSDD
jgi:penicillin-binding protein 1A